MPTKTQTPAKRGRLARSPKSRAEQVVSAQREFRIRMKEQGYRPVQVYIREKLVEAIDKDARFQTLSRGEKLEQILEPIYLKKTKGKK